MEAVFYNFCGPGHVAVFGASFLSFSKAEMSNGNFCRFCKELFVCREAWCSRTVACWTALWML